MQHRDDGTHHNPGTQDERGTQRDGQAAPYRYAAERVRDQIRAAVRDAVAACIAAGGLPEAAAQAPVTLEVPRERAHGDYSTNVAMVTARTVGLKPRDWAERIVSRIDTAGTFIDRVEVAGPGFINFYLRPQWLYGVLDDVLALGPRYGDTHVGQGRRVVVEFVSANPTGPLNVVNARHAALGDSLASLLAAAGYRVAREFYVNDAGNQFRMLALAMDTRLRELLGEPAELPEGAYPGEYVIDLARQFAAQHPDAVSARPPRPDRGRAGGAAESGGAGESGAGEGAGSGPVLAGDETWEAWLERIGRFAVERILEDQRKTLERFGVRYDRWARESEIRAAGLPGQVLQRLAERGHTYQRDGAVWLRTTAFGDDKDRVLVKRDGQFTYVLPDIAYHVDKLQRGFDLLINLLGQDHHGHHVRLKAGLEALGYDPDVLEVIYLQMVHLTRGGEAVRMSKRRGEFVSMGEFLDEVSTDAARYFFLMRSADTTMDFDVDLANLQTQENPVYYVQYAHARISGILRQAAEQGVEVPAAGAAGHGDLPAGAARPSGAEAVDLPPVDLSPIADPREFDLLRKLADLPDELAAAAEAREPHRLTHYAYDLASTFHQFYVHCRVLGEAPEVTRARLLLVRATQVVLAKVLGILGVSAPERM
ncbi:MAG: arginine--tRNA ligase [Thermaerobacter sp.]